MLVSRSWKREAREVVYGLHGDDDRSSADREFTQVNDVIKAEFSGRSRRLSGLWATRAMVRRTLVAVVVQLFTQFTGINGTCVIIASASDCNLSF